ncbi:MAG: hypothetical protein NVS3B21_32460 [Acidimicrobiales bacterium]
MARPVTGKTEAGQRREARARETRRRIIEAALRLFLEKGYSNTTVGEIAAAALVAPATIYQAFGTKGAVLASALDHTVAGDDIPLAVLDRRYRTQEGMVDVLIGNRDLRAGIDRRHAVDTFFALVNSATYDLLVTQRGWTLSEWQAWLAEVIERELFGVD